LPPRLNPNETAVILLLGNVTIGQFFPGNSPVHRVDARIKLILTVAYIAAVFMVGNVWGYLILAAAIAAAARLSGIQPKYLLRGLKPLVFILAFTFILNVFFTRGETPLFSWWIIRIYPEGVRNAVFFALRLAFLVVGTSILTLTTSPIELTDALERLMRPLKAIKFPAHELAMMMSIALRFFPYADGGKPIKIMKEQTARGADFESVRFCSAPRRCALLVPLFVSAFRRADELAMAMSRAAIAAISTDTI
jgi:energy-coupling factor transport system permease protein